MNLKLLKYMFKHDAKLYIYQNKNYDKNHVNHCVTKVTQESQRTKT